MSVFTGGHAIAAAIRRHGVDTVFGLPGAQIYPLFDGFHREGIRTIVPRHEQTAGYMAMGYAKSTGRLGAFAVVPGPGVLNASAALCTAMGNCSPVLCITGQVPSEFLGKGRGHLHELPDQLATLRGIVKDARRIDSVARVPDVVDDAVRYIRAGRPGPVSVEMCWDTMAMQADIEIPALQSPATAPEPDPDSIREAVRLIERARKPMIMCGAGAQDASAEVAALADRLGAPVTAFRSGRGVVGEDSPLGLNAVGARLLWDDTDLLIGVGSRLEMPFMRWRNMMHYEPRPAGSPLLLRIDIDPQEMSRLIPDVGVIGDAAASCAALVEALEGSSFQRIERASEIDAARAAATSLIEAIRPHAAFLAAIRRVLPRDGFFVPELCQAGFASYTGAFPVLAPRTYVTEGFQGTLGYGFPTALGVKIANPERAVVSITGDGGFMFAVQELATAAQYGIGVVTVVFDNGAFGNVLRDQRTLFDGRVVGARFRNPSFVDLAESFGVAARRVESPAALERTLGDMLGNDSPGLIEIPVAPDSEVSPWPLIHMPRQPVVGDLGQR